MRGRTLVSCVDSSSSSEQAKEGARDQHDVGLPSACVREDERECEDRATTEQDTPLSASRAATEANEGERMRDDTFPDD